MVEISHHLNHIKDIYCTIFADLVNRAVLIPQQSMHGWYLARTKDFLTPPITPHNFIVMLILNARWRPYFSKIKYFNSLMMLLQIVFATFSDAYRDFILISFIKAR